ncbi:hypothetical protein CRM22_001190 [Opisthorchis felineus]|uniref:Uncharacterized protein n=1 Tax=Opisthorchis felineus TaxID=147828 RepID=A0A4S2MBR8_OPIFE|nr:hypothetical protein CRM22_001190 [Opisthorchis felineus]
MDMLPESRTAVDSVYSRMPLSDTRKNASDSYSYKNELLLNVSFNPLRKSEDEGLQDHLEKRITSALSDSEVSKSPTPEFLMGLSTVTEILPPDYQQTVNSLQGFVQPGRYTISMSNLTAMVYGPDKSCLNPVTNIYNGKYTSAEERMGQDCFMAISFTLTFNHRQNPITTDVEYENAVSCTRLTHLTEMVRRYFDESDMHPGAREVLDTLDYCLIFQGDNEDDPGTWCDPPRSPNRDVSSGGNTPHGIGTTISSRITVPSWTENVLQIREANSRSVLVSSELRYSSHWFRTTDYRPETQQLDFSHRAIIVPTLSVKPTTMEENISLKQMYPCVNQHRILLPCVFSVTGYRTGTFNVSSNFEQMKGQLRFNLQGTVYPPLFSSSDPVIVADDSSHMNSLANPSAIGFPFPSSSTPRLILPTYLSETAPDKPLSVQPLQSLVSDVHEFRLTKNLFSKLGKGYCHTECSRPQPYRNNEKGTKTPFLFDFNEIKSLQQRQMSNQAIPAFETPEPSDDETPVHFFVELHNESNEEAGSQKQMFLGRRSDRSERRSRPSSTELPLPKRIIDSIRRTSRIGTLLDVNGSVASGLIPSLLSKQEQHSALTSFTEPVPREGLIHGHRESVSVVNEAQGPENQGHPSSVGLVNVLNLPESEYPLSSHFSKQDVTVGDPVGTNVREGRHAISGGTVNQHEQSETRRSPSLGRRTTFKKRLSSFRRSVNLREMMESCWKADVNDNPVGISDSAQRLISLNETNLVSLHGTDAFLEEPPKCLASIDGKQKESNTGSAEHSSGFPVPILNELGSGARLHDSPDEAALEMPKVHPTILPELPNTASSKDSSKPAVEPHLTSGDQISDEDLKQHNSILASPEDPGAFDYTRTSDTTGDDCDNPTDTSYADTNRVCFLSEGQVSLINQLEVNRISVRTSPLSVQYVPNRPGIWSSFEPTIDNGTPYADSTGPVAHISRPQQSQEKTVPRLVSPLSELWLSGTHSIDSLSAGDIQKAYAQLSVCMLPEQDTVRYDKGEKVTVSRPPSYHVNEFVQKVHKQKARKYDVKEVPVLTKSSRPDGIHGTGERPQLVVTEQSFDQTLLSQQQLVEGNPVPFAVTTGTNRSSFSEDSCKSVLGQPRNKDLHTDPSVIDPAAEPHCERSSKRSHMTFYQIPSIEMEPSISVGESARLPPPGQHPTMSSRCTLATGISDAASDRLNGEEVHDIQPHETQQIQNTSGRKHHHCPNRRLPERRKSGNEDSHSGTCLCEFLTPIFPAIPDGPRENGLTNLIQVEELEVLQRNVTPSKAVEESPQRTMIVGEEELTDCKKVTAESLLPPKTLEAPRDIYIDDHLLNKSDSGSERLKIDENYTYQTPQVYIGKGSDTQQDLRSGSPRSPSSDYHSVHSSDEFKRIDRRLSEQLNSSIEPTMNEQSSQRKSSTIPLLEVSQRTAVHDAIKQSSRSNEETDQVHVVDISSIVTHASFDPETLVEVATNSFTTISVNLETEKSDKVGSQLSGFHCLCQPHRLYTERLRITPVSPKPSEYRSRVNQTHSDYPTTSLNTEMHSEVGHSKSEPVVLDGTGLSTNEKDQGNYVPTKVESPTHPSEMQITALLPASQLLPELVTAGYYFSKADACRAVSTALPENIKQDNPQTKSSNSEPKTFSSADTSRLLSKSSPILTSSTGSTYYTTPPPIQRNVTETMLISGPLGEVLSPTLTSTPSTSCRWKLGLPKTGLKIGADSCEVADSGPMISASREVLCSFQPLFSWNPYPNDKAVVNYPPAYSDPTRATSLETDRCEPLSASPTPKVTNTLPAPRCTCRKSRSLSPGPHVIHSSTVIALNHLHCLHNGCVPFRSSSSQQCPVEQHALDNPGGSVCIHTSIGLNKAPGTCQHPVCCPKFGLHQLVPCEHCQVRKTASSGPGMNGSHGCGTADTAPTRTNDIVALPEKHKQANPVFSATFTVPQTSESPSPKYGFMECKIESGHSSKVAAFSNNWLYDEMNRSELDSPTAVRNDSLGSREALERFSKREAAECTLGMYAGIQKSPNQDQIQVNPNSTIITCREKSRVLSAPAASPMGSGQRFSTHPGVIYSAQEHDTFSHCSNCVEMQLSRGSFPSDQQTLVSLTGGPLAHFSNNYYASEHKQTVYTWMSPHNKDKSCNKSEFLNCDTLSATEDSSETRRPDHSEPSKVKYVNELPLGQCTNKHTSDLPMITSPVVIEPPVGCQQAIPDEQAISANQSSDSTVGVIGKSIKKVQAEQSTDLKQIADQASATSQTDLPEYVSHIEREAVRMMHSRNEPTDQSSPASVDRLTHAVKNPSHLSVNAKAGFGRHSANLPLLPSPVGTIDYLQHFRKLSAASSKSGSEQRASCNTDSSPVPGMWNKSYPSQNGDPMKFANLETVQTETVEFAVPNARCRQKGNENQPEKGCDIKPTISDKALSVQRPVVRSIHSLECGHCRFKTTHSTSDSSFSSVADRGRYTQHEVACVKVDSSASCSRAISASSYSSRRIRSRWPSLARPIHNAHAKMTPKSRNKSLQSSKHMHTCTPVLCQRFNHRLC